MTIGYDQLSRRSSLSFSNGTSCNYGFELNSDLSSLAHSFVGSSVNMAYGFNKAHEITGDVFSDPNYYWTPGVSGTTVYSAANNLNEYPQVGGVNYSYNQNGCLTGDGVWTWGYDTENHLVSASKSGSSSAYLYDVFHRQTQKAVTAGSTTKTRYIYSGWQRLADYDGTSGALQNRYVYGVGLDEPLIQVSSAGVLTFFHANHQGSIIAISDNTGVISNHYTYGPFGETSSLPGTTFGYTGQRFDVDNGLYFYKRRYYSPTLGRFLQPDPIGYDITIRSNCGCGCSGGCGGADPEAGNLNLYGYVNNEPLNYSDPLGAFAIAAVPLAAMMALWILAYVAAQMALKKLEELAKKCPPRIELPTLPDISSGLPPFIGNFFPS